MYIRKTHDEYEIHANYGYGMEYVCTAEDLVDAKQLLRTYRENEPGVYHTIKKRRVINTQKKER